MYQQRLSHLIHTQPLKVALILLVLAGLLIAGVFGLEAAQGALSNSPAAIRLAPLSRVQLADAARYTGLAAEKYNLYGSTAWTRAPKPPLPRSQTADAARYTGLAAEKYNLYGSTAWTRAPKPSLSRSQTADAARYTGLAAEKYNLYGSTAWTRAPKNELTRSQLAEATRWTALAIRLGKPPESISDALKAVLGE